MLFSSFPLSSVCLAAHRAAKYFFIISSNCGKFHHKSRLFTFNFYAAGDRSRFRLLFGGHMRKAPLCRVGTGALKNFWVMREN